MSRFLRYTRAMASTDQIFSYCERGQNPAFWAEPFNAVSNAAFLAAALAAGIAWSRQPASVRGTPEAALIGLVAIIGVGSFLFHTFATRWANIADAGPIGAFMFAYAGYTLRRFLALPWIPVAVGLVLFAALLQIAFTADCPVALRGLVRGGRCLNGSAGYLPALAMLLGSGLAALARRHGAGPYLFAASAVFALSLAARTIDLEACGASRILGAQRGTHALWHTLNALTLAILLFAALRHGARAPFQDQAVR